MLSAGTCTLLAVTCASQVLLICAQFAQSVSKARYTKPRDLLLQKGAM